MRLHRVHLNLGWELQGIVFIVRENYEKATERKDCTVEDTSGSLQGGTLGNTSTHFLEGGKGRTIEVVKDYST